MERAVHVVIAGRVQGVGFRAFVVQEAKRLDVAGWVRNRRDGTVEAVLIGPSDAVEMIIALCRDGPALADVRDVAVSDYAGPELTRFTELPTE